MDALLDFYEGAYGPTIRFDANSLGSLCTLRKTFRRLASVETREVRTCLPGISSEKRKAGTGGVVSSDG